MYKLALLAFSLPLLAADELKVSPETFVYQLKEEVTYKAKLAGKDVTTLTIGGFIPEKIGSWSPMTSVNGLKFKAPDMLDAGIVDAELTAVVTDTVSGKTAPITIRIYTPDWTPDERKNFEATGFLGVAIDNFAAQDFNNLVHADESGKIKTGYIAGVNFQYRLFGNPKKKKWSPQLWVYGETVHAQRSSEVDCGTKDDTTKTKPEICSLKTGDVIQNPATTFYSILRDADSLEAYVGMRLEFYAFQLGSKETVAKAYLKSELGFLTVAGQGGDVVDSHQHIALGAVATNGKFSSSYLEVGWGRTDLFRVHRGRRFKVDGYLSWDFNKWMVKYGMSPFLQMTVDSDFGPGADSVRSYYGFNFELGKLFRPGIGHD